MIAVLVPALLLSLARAFDLDDNWWLELLHYAPYPAYLLPAIVACVASLWLGRAWRFGALLALGLVLTVIMGLAFGHSDAGSGRVRMMTYNIKSYLTGDEPGAYGPLAWEVASHDPDILVMQDASFLIDSRAEAPQTAAAIFKDKQVYAFGQYMVVTRFPMRDCHPGDISFRGENHTYVRCTLTIRGQDVDLVTVHFLSPREGLNATRHEQLAGIADWQQNFADRYSQARRLAADLAGRKRPLIVAGDLNAPESSPVLRTLLGLGLRDAYSSAAFGYGYTHGHSLRLRISLLRIDHILVSPEIGVHAAEAGGKEASEHRPVIADLLFDREPG